MGTTGVDVGAQFGLASLSLISGLGLLSFHRYRYHYHSTLGPYTGARRSFRLRLYASIPVFLSAYITHLSASNLHGASSMGQRGWSKR